MDLKCAVSYKEGHIKTLSLATPPLVINLRSNTQQESPFSSYSFWMKNSQNSRNFCGGLGSLRFRVKHTIERTIFGIILKSSALHCGCNYCDECLIVRVGVKAVEKIHFEGFQMLTKPNNLKHYKHLWWQFIFLWFCYRVWKKNCKIKSMRKIQFSLLTNKNMCWEIR
jgi:hypothetical protein